MKTKFLKKTSLKAFLATLLVLALVLSLTSCGKSSKPNSSNPSNNTSKPSGNTSTPSTEDINETLFDQPDVPASKSAYPAPQMVENPQLLKEFPKPSAVIATSKFSDKFSVEFTGTAATDGPQIGSITEQAGPNDSISIYGTGFAGGKVYAYGLENGVGQTKQLATTVQRDDFVNAVIPAEFDYGMYIIWIEGKGGKIGAPVRVNAPKLTWVSADKASENAEIRIYGKFLTTNNADGKEAKSYVYITKDEKRYAVDVIEATPYRLTVKLPSGLENEQTYKIWVHNGHGGGHGWSNPLSIQYKSGAENFWTGKKHTVKLTNGMATDEDIVAAIDAAADGDTIYFAAGTYVINDQVKVEKSLKFEGESKDKVIIVGVFAKTTVPNTSLAYGDWNVNGEALAAIDVSVTPCEFTGITFTEYVENSDLYSGVAKPSNYNLNYAYGILINGYDTDDTGISGQLKIHNCNFKIQRCYSNAKNCIYFGSKQQQKYHEEFAAKYKHYATDSRYGAAPLWIHTDRTEIANCYFEGPKEITIRHMNKGYVHDNTFVGTWVIAGNSGTCAIYDNSSECLDISNNRIMGMDEKTDPNGYVQTGDQTFGRTIVFQNSLTASKNNYIMNNEASRVGELNYNSGEHILFEEMGISYHGSVTLSNGGLTLKFDNLSPDKWVFKNDTYRFVSFRTRDSGEIEPYPGTRQIVGQSVIISKGKGQGQYRTITEVAENCVATIDRPWDIMPDSTSEFVLAQAFTNSVVYANKIEGPKLYYKNYNSTNGVNAYATMLGGIIDRNNFSQMQAGLAINPHYNPKVYIYQGKKTKVDFGFNMYSEFLVMNNTINDTRYGIWNFPSITLDSIDSSAEEATLQLQLGVIIRGNTISNQRRLTGGADINDSTTPAVIKRGGVSIVVGRDYGEASQVLSTRYWMCDVVVENNKLSKPANAYIDISFSQNGTIVRNNSYDGKTGLSLDKVDVAHGTHSSGKKPQAPAYFK